MDPILFLQEMRAKWWTWTWGVAWCCSSSGWRWRRACGRSLRAHRRPAGGGWAWRGTVCPFWRPSFAAPPSSSASWPPSCSTGAAWCRAGRNTTVSVRLFVSHPPLIYFLLSTGNCLESRLLLFSAIFFFAWNFYWKNCLYCLPIFFQTVHWKKHILKKMSIT